MSTRVEIAPLTGLRGIAVLLVINAHFGNWTRPFSIDEQSRALYFWFTYTADFGMTLFFTLSGFVIVYNYLDFDWRTRAMATFSRFVWLRLSRLYPALLLFLVLTLNSAGFAKAIGEYWVVWTIAHFFSLQTWAPLKAGNALAFASWFGVSWSISTEIMMYLMFGVFLIIASKFGRIVGASVCLASTAVILSIAFIDDITIAAASMFPGPLEPVAVHEWRLWFVYTSPYFRIINFLFGGLVARTILRNTDVLDSYRPQLRWATAAAIGALCAIAILTQPFQVIGPTTSLAWIQIVTSLAFSIIMLNGGDSSSYVNRLLSRRGILYIGVISYSLYLFQGFMPRIAVPGVVGEFGAALLPLYAFNYGMTLFVAVIFATGAFILIEEPAKNALRRFWHTHGVFHSGGIGTTAAHSRASGNPGR